MAPLDELLGSHDTLADDALAELVSKLEAPVRDVVVALWQRVRGDVKPADGPAAAVPVPVADQLAAGVHPAETVTVADQKAGAPAPEKAKYA